MRQRGPRPCGCPAAAWADRAVAAVHLDAPEAEEAAEKALASAADAEGNGVALLTERELEVARLVDRKTNPEIAAQLFISQKDSRDPPPKIFHKIDASSRVELARVVEAAERTSHATTCS